MNSELGTPSRSQQPSPAPLNTHQLSTACMDIQLATPTISTFGLSSMEVSTPTTQTMDMGASASQFGYLNGAYPTRSFSPTSMDFANMSITAGYPTPQSMTPVSVQQQQQQPALHMDSAAASADVAPGASAVAATPTTTPTTGSMSAEKPDFSYASLIAQSLKDAPMQRRTLNGIYEWIQENFPYYRSRQNWQNSIRHNLSLNKGFMKVKRDETHPGKGSFWTFTPGYESCLNSGHFKPVRSRSGRAALAAAAAMAAAAAAANKSSNGLQADFAADETNIGGSQPTTAAGKKGDKRIGLRSAKSAKSLKRSHSVPPKEHRHLLTRSSVGTAKANAAANGTGTNCSSVDSLAHGSGTSGHSLAKKMRVSSTQSHLSTSTVHPSPLHITTSLPPQGPFSLSSAFMPSPALASATPVSALSTSNTPLSHAGPFQFAMQPTCSVSMAAMDVPSIPAMPTARISSDGAAINGSYVSTFVPPFGDAPASIDNAGLFTEHGGEMMYGARRAHMQSRISWHGPESMTHAYASLQQQHGHGSGSMLMGSESDIGLSMLPEPHTMGICADNSVTGSPVDWTMIAGIPAPSSAAADHSAHTPQLQHMADSHQQQHHRMSNGSMIAGEVAIAGPNGETNSTPGLIAFYDEMMRDPSSLMNVLGQDMPGWQCPTKANTIDPAALCAVDPESNSNL
ncbi:Forkhead box protein I2 [Dipsacomyces acuminosporus]|nr:Forkhead box protein I2 [Dipsacomyces acuminosporus]